MMLAQANPHSRFDRFYGIREGWADQTSYTAVFWVIAFLAAGFLVLFVVRMLSRWLHARRIDDPRRLFSEVLRPLVLTVIQRDLLRRIAKELRLEHPCVFLLSPELFRIHTNRWMSVSGRATVATRQRLDRLAGTLFPDQK